MTYYDDNEDLDCYFDDDSSAEEELLRVTEKLETMRQQEDAEAKKKTEKEEEEEAITTNCRCPKYSSPGCTPDSLLVVPDTIEIYGGTVTSHSTSIDSAHRNRTSFRYNNGDERVNVQRSRYDKDDIAISSINSQILKNKIEGQDNIDKDNSNKHQQTRKDQKKKIQQLQSKQVSNASEIIYPVPASDLINENKNNGTTTHSLGKGRLFDDSNVNDVDNGIINKVVSMKSTAGSSYDDEVIVNLATINTSASSTKSSTSASGNSNETSSRETDPSDGYTSSSTATSFVSGNDGSDGDGGGDKNRDRNTGKSNQNRCITIKNSSLIKKGHNATEINEIVPSGTSRRVTPPLRNPYIRGENVAIARELGVHIENTELVGNIHGNQTQEPMPKSYGDIAKATVAAMTTTTTTTTTTEQTRTRMVEHEEKISVDRRQQERESESEISTSLYAPPAYQEGQPVPTVNRFDYQNRPSHSRQTFPVQSSNIHLPPSIVNSLWTKKFDRFNHFQSEMFDSLSHSDDNIVVSAPTGAGKSTLFEMAIARFVYMDLQAQDQQHASTPTPTLSSKPSLVSKARKIIYVAPSKALCKERYEDWSRRLQDANLGLEVALIIGQEENDLGARSFSDLIAAHLIVTTPEKLDSMTRRWNENFFLFASVKLLLLDEVHLLGDENRGWCLESVVTRMKTIHRAAQALDATPDEIRTSSYSETNPKAIRSCFRIVAVSATLPNISEVADFLQVNKAFAFDDSYRPVPLTKHVNGLGRVGNNEWKFWSNLSEHTPEIIERFSHGKQSLIFCHSKKETQKITELLIRRNFGNKSAQKLDPPWNVPVQYMLSHGIGYHHAGMNMDERKRIEEAFVDGKIKCLAATSTLAVGVNLPAHLVIIVGTKAYRSNEKGKGYQDIEASSLMQMIGRAGRPGLDSTGVAVVLTDNNSKKKIENLLESGFGPAKSNLCTRLQEVINTEISQRVVTCTEGAVRWLQTTFLFSCMKQNEKDPVSLARKLSSDAIQYLKDIGIIEQGNQNSIRPLAGSHVMNQHLISFEAMKVITTFPFDASQCQILRSISKLESLQSFVRRSERKDLKNFHKTEMMKYKLPGILSTFTVKDPSEKAFILLQSFISRHVFENKMLNDEHSIVINKGRKKLQAAQEYSVKASKHGKVALECCKLLRSLDLRLWGESSGIFNQINCIGSASIVPASRCLLSGIRSFQDALNSSEEELNKILCNYTVQQNPGRKVKEVIAFLCRNRLRLFAELAYTRNSNIPVELICTLKYNDPSAAMTRKEGGKKLTFSLIAYTDNSVDSKLIFEQNICSPSTFSATLSMNSFNKIFIHLVGSWVGFDEKKVIDVKGKNLLPFNVQSDRQLNTSEKRKIRQTEVTSYTNQRHSKKRHQTTSNLSKDPSPITPPPLPLEKFWKEPAPKIEYCDIRAGERWSSGCSKSFPQRYTGELTVSSPLTVNITPTMRLPNRRIEPDGRGWQSTTIKGAHGRNEELPIQEHQTFADAVPKPIYSKRSNFEKSIGHIPLSQELFVEDRYQVHREESSDSALAKENANVETKNDMVARRDLMPSIHLDDHSTPSTLRPRNLENSWKQSQRKQQRDQKRAFIEKKTNPFKAFTHDPNDSEKHLEQLIQQSSIIPTPLLAKMKQKSVTSSKIGTRHFSNSWNRRARTRHVTQSHQDVLREKADEQQFCQNQMMVAQQQYEANQNHHQNCYQEQNQMSPSLPPIRGWQHPMQHPRDQSFMLGYQQHQHQHHPPHFDEYYPNPEYPQRLAPERSTPVSRGYPREVQFPISNEPTSPSGCVNYHSNFRVFDSKN